MKQPSIFGPPPLLEDEDIAAYNELLRRVTDLIRPNDIIEEIWIRDFVDLTWERFRWRRDKIELLPDVLDSDSVEDMRGNFTLQFPLNFAIVERVDRLIAIIEQRCNAILHEIGRHREIKINELTLTHDKRAENKV